MERMERENLKDYFSREIHGKEKFEDWKNYLFLLNRGEEFSRRNLNVLLTYNKFTSWILISHRSNIKNSIVVWRDLEMRSINSRKNSFSFPYENSSNQDEWNLDRDHDLNWNISREESKCFGRERSRILLDPAINFSQTDHPETSKKKKKIRIRRFNKNIHRSLSFLKDSINR